MYKSNSLSKNQQGLRQSSNFPYQLNSKSNYTPLTLHTFHHPTTPNVRYDLGNNIKNHHSMIKSTSNINLMYQSNNFEKYDSNQNTKKVKKVNFKKLSKPLQIQNSIFDELIFDKKPINVKKYQSQKVLKFSGIENLNNEIELKKRKSSAYPMLNYNYSNKNNTEAEHIPNKIVKKLSKPLKISSKNLVSNLITPINTNHYKTDEKVSINKTPIMEKIEAKIDNNTAANIISINKSNSLKYSMKKKSIKIDYNFDLTKVLKKFYDEVASKNISISTQITKANLIIINSLKRRRQAFSKKLRSQSLINKKFIPKCRNEAEEIINYNEKFYIPSDSFSFSS